MILAKLILTVCVKLFKLDLAKADKNYGKK